MDISEFLIETKKQYIDLLISSKIASEADRATIEAKLKDFKHGYFSDELGTAQAEVKTEEVDDHKEAILYANRNLISTLENINDVNDPALDKLRQTIFHETTHVLQLNEQMDENVGYITPQREGYGANEAAAEMAEQLIMIEYLKNVRGLENAGLVSVTAHENGVDFQAVEVSQDTTTHDKSQNIQAGSYFREVSVVRDALKKMGAPDTDFIRNSFGFKEQERENFATEFGRSVGDFNQFNTDLTTMLVYERQNADESVVTLDEYKEAATRIKTTPEEQRQTVINEFGEIERNGDAPFEIDPSIPTFTPPEPKEETRSGVTINEFGEIERNGDGPQTLDANIPIFTPPEQNAQNETNENNGNVSRIDPEELRKAREELGLDANEPITLTNYTKSKEQASSLSKE